MFLKNRSFQKEYLDGEITNKSVLRQNFREIEKVNRLLGGNLCTLMGFKKFYSTVNELTFVDIGCGSGDNILFLAKYAQKKGLKVNFIGIDLLPEIIEQANINLKNHSNVSFICSDYKKVVFDKKPDVIFSALFCHHLDNNELDYFVNWMNKNSKKGWFINDLHRHFISYFFIKLICTYPRLSYLFKHDAPLSVKRSFVKKDFKKYQDININWVWSFRWLVYHNIS